MEVDKLEIKVTAESESAAAALDRLSASLQRLQSATKQPGLEKTSQQLKSVAKAPSMTRLERELKRVESQAIKDGDALVKLQTRLENLQQFRGIGNPLTNEAVEKEVRATEAAIKRLSSAVDEADAKIRTLRGSMADAADKTAAPVKKAAQQIRAAEPALEKVSASAKSVNSNLKAASKSAEQLGKSVKKAGNTGAGGMSYLAKSIRGMVTSFALFGAIYSITGAISDSLGEMAKENDGVNQTLSEIKSSLQYVSDALAAVIYPIIKAIAPIVVTILDAVAGILNLLARVIGFFTGQDSVIQATKAQTDFAGSLDGTADSMDGVTGAAKRMQRALLPIDELNILDDSSGGGGIGGTLGGVRFEETSVDSVKLPDIIKSPMWSPDPIPAPEFAPLLLPEWATAPIPVPEWVPEFIPAPIFAALTLPAWALSPLPVPVWAENPIIAPELATEPTESGLVALRESFSSAWENINVTVSGAITAVQEYLTNGLERIKTWGTNIKTNVTTAFNYVKAAIESGLTTAKERISTFISNTAASIAEWGGNVMTNIRTTVSYIAESIGSGLTSAAEAVASWIGSVSSNFASWGSNLIKTAASAVSGFVQNFISGLSAAWDSFVGFMKGIGEKISNWWSGNKSWAAPVLGGIALAGITVAAITLTGGSALAAVPALAALANGGVLTEPTAILAGEYPGARANPEIVTPQKLLRETFREEQNNGEVINALLSCTQQVITAIRENGGDVYLDGAKVSQRITKAQNRQNRMYGKTLQMV